MEESEREAALNWLRAESERMKREDEEFRALMGLPPPVQKKDSMWKLAHLLKEIDRKLAALSEAQERSTREWRERMRRQEEGNG